jgi:ubiquinol-cytochrome c reductase iron-sulfur subunit
VIRLIAAVVLEQMDRAIAVALRLLGINREEIREDLYPYAGPGADDKTNPDTRNERRIPANPRAELALAALLLAAGMFGFAFLLLFAFDDNNQLLGLSLGLALACLAAGLILAGKRVIPQEQLVEERPELVHEVEAGESAELLRGGLEGISRRRLLAGAAGVTGLGLGGALLAPLASSGPNVGQLINDTPWHKGRGVIDVNGAPILADDVVEKTFLTGFPDNANPEELSSPIVIVRVPLAQLRLPDGRTAAQWAPEGIVAYSKICTHAGCAISLYRTPLFAPHEPRPALVCPCHYSTFDPARGAAVIFGPAGRSLPQLPLAIEPATRRLVANGAYSGSIGPAWFSVNRGSRA